LVFTFDRTDLSIGAATITCQWSTDLTFPTPANDVLVPASGTTTINDVVVDITDNSPGSDKDKIRDQDYPNLSLIPSSFAPLRLCGFAALRESLFTPRHL
jgi:hypothetical protein